MRTLRVLALLAIASLIVACAPEPTASELTAKSVANLKSAKTAHLEGAGSIALKGGFSFGFDFTFSGDTELPDKARMTLHVSTIAQGASVESITIGDAEYTKDQVSGTWTRGSGRSSITSVIDPLGNMDAAVMHDVVEVDRPVVDGHKTRHLRYDAESTKMLDAMRTSAGVAPQALSNAKGTGELWIRIDDAQIVRQLVTVSLDIVGPAGLGLPTASASTGKTSLELSMDLRFSHHGEAIPQITAPPVGR